MGGGNLIVNTKKCSEFIEISIADTGIGITKENLKNLFHPLFSTKKGVLGLVWPSLSSRRTAW
jgi:signal transduction histidine kinase